MPANTIALLTVALASQPSVAQSFSEQASTVSPGNNFDWGPDTGLYVRNTTAGALDITFEAHVVGAERTVGVSNIPGSGTAHGVKIFSGFPLDWTEHGGVDSGKIYVRAAGTNGQIVFCPFVIKRG